ncbi:MAG TPA: hypothetical protein VIO64_20700 [Pseudobacteroides sp.]|uniref:hypothetical protein n=1 Tax=Pseudobacteroides sp. TaxID=1968840 RepID=UPI002F95BED2
MNKEYKFGRMFLILKRDDEGFGLAKDPTGYVKIEVTDGKGKLFAHIENLNDKQEKTVFKLYLIACNKEQFNPVCVGILPLKEGKGELSWKFDASNVGSTGRSMDKFNVVAVAATEVQRRNSMAFPLVAFKGAEVSWKDKLKETLYPKVFVDYQNSGDIENIKAENLKSQNLEPENIGTENIESENVETENNETENSEVENTGIENIEAENTGTDNIESENIWAENIETENNEAENIETENIVTENIEAESIEQDNIEAENMVVESPKVQEVEEENIHIKVGEDTQEGINAKFAAQENSTWKNSEPCSNVNNCMNCENNRFNKFNFDTRSTGIDTHKLKELFNKNFEVANPFKNGCRIYKWWNVNNPVVLNNIFYQSNLRNPFLFNPKVLFAYYKHRSLIVGICNDISSDKEYIVLGVPGNYSSEQRPLGMFCRWAQEEGVEPKNGAFGFWLVYIDPNSGKIIG